MPLAKTHARGLGHAWQQLTHTAYTTYGYTCYADRCLAPSRAIDPTLPSTHRLSKTIDHLDPRATHGTQLPTIDRVRPTHRACNSSKGTTHQPTNHWHSRNW
jgi:hypothetical protein